MIFDKAIDVDKNANKYLLFLYHWLVILSYSNVLRVTVLEAGKQGAPLKGIFYSFFLLSGGSWNPDVSRATYGSQMAPKYVGTLLLLSYLEKGRNILGGSCRHPTLILRDLSRGSKWTELKFYFEIYKGINSCNSTINDTRKVTSYIVSYLSLKVLSNSAQPCRHQTE